MGASHAILGTEVERLVVPLAVDIDDTIKLWIFRWRLDIVRLQHPFNEVIRLCGDFRFQRFGEKSGRRFAWIHSPRIDFLWHLIPSFAAMSDVFVIVSRIGRWDGVVAFSLSHDQSKLREGNLFWTR